MQTKETNGSAQNATPKDNLYIIANPISKKMAQKKNVYTEKLTQVGYWNYDEVYKFLFNWLKDEGYGIAETAYKEKLSGGGKEILISWDAGKKVTDYFKRQILLEWHILGMKDAEVEIDGKKVSTNKGELEIKFVANLVKDYEARWEDKPLHKFMRGLYENYIIRTTVTEYEDNLEDECKALIADLKAFLRIPTA